MKLKKRVLKKCLIQQILIITIFVTVAFSVFRAGEEFQVNTYTEGPQGYPAVAMDERGYFAITWIGYEQDGSTEGIFAQRFNKDGKPLGSEFQVNTYTKPSQQSLPAVAMDRKGKFIITWHGWGPHFYEVFAQRFRKNGKPIGPEFQVNTYTEFDQEWPAVAMNRQGKFVITWHSSEHDGNSYDIFAQRFRINGKPIGPEFQVNTYTESAQVLPAVAMDVKGNFVITWESLEQDGDDYGIFAQRFNKNGKPLGPEFQVNTNSFREQTWPAVAMDAKGNFVITWEGLGDGSGEGIFAQRFNKNGEPIGEEFQVNTHTIDWQEGPAVAVDVKGNFVITWHSYGQDGSEEGVFAQRFNKKGKPLGPELQVNSYTKFFQEWPAVAMHKNGNFVITWHSLQDGSCSGIFAKMYKKQEKSTSNNTLQYDH